MMDILCIGSAPWGVIRRAAGAMRQGADVPGQELPERCARMGLEVAHGFRSKDMPTDRHKAIGDAGGRIAALADVHAPEGSVSGNINPIHYVRLCPSRIHRAGDVALYGNLAEAFAAEIARSPLAAAAARVSRDTAS